MLDPAQSPTVRRRLTSRLLLAGMLVLLLPIPAATLRPARPSQPAAIAADLAPTPTKDSWQPAPSSMAGLNTVATSGSGGFVLHTAGGPRRFLPGVNLGSTTPGHQPGELAISAEQYRSWFDTMGRLGIRCVRIYTIHPPAFYTELAAYNNAHPSTPLYLMQGVYLPDETHYVRLGNLYEPTSTAAFTQELTDASAAVSGQLQRSAQRGRASGSWQTDVSRWLVGWLIGVEWDPSAVTTSDRRNATVRVAAGHYFAATATASPTERWLAARMNELATTEARRGRSTPIAFVNWPTTDPLPHPQEPLDREDMVGIDANHVRATAAWPGGTFASYHAYPYYPDFQRYEPGLLAYRYAGRPDPYAGYLTALRRHHGQLPVMITEFGVPSSIGTAHRGPLGRDQGDHSEAAAMQLDAGMLRMMRQLGLAGAMIFGWADEWFKFTWNTVNHQRPAEDRSLWHDALTNEQYFGLLATDPLPAPDNARRVVWHDDAGATVRQVEASYDPSYLQLRVTLAAGNTPHQIQLGLDPLPALTGPPQGSSTDTRADVSIAFDVAGGTAQVWLRDALDPIPLDYLDPRFPRTPAVGGWRHYELITNRALRIPGTGREVPPEFTNIGALRAGHWSPPDGPGVDSRSTWYRDGDVLVLRLPWALAGFADPSSAQVLVPRGRAPATVTADGVGLTVTTVGATPATTATGRLTWATWRRVYYQERLKPHASDVRQAMLDAAG